MGVQIAPTDAYVLSEAVKMAERGFYSDQLGMALSEFLAKRWVTNNTQKIHTIIMETDPSEYCQFTNNSLSMEDVGHWVSYKSGAVEEVSHEVASSSMGNDTIIQISGRSNNTLEGLISFFLKKEVGHFIKTTWLKHDASREKNAKFSELRKATRSCSMIGKILES